MRAPILVMVAGPNGSGKSTLTDALRASPDVHLPRTYINADEIQRAQGFDDLAAQRAARELRARAIAERCDVMYETVMSHPSKVAELQQARAAGYRVAIHFVATVDPSINVERVALRVAAGGHSVPEERTRQRYQRTIALAPAAFELADEVLIFDNSQRGAEGGLQLLAQLVGLRLELATEKPASWVTQLVRQMNERTEELMRFQESAQLPLQAARLNGGRSEGPIEILGNHYVVQKDLGTKTFVLHDRLLLPEEQPMQEGKAYRIVYTEGVGIRETLTQRLQTVATERSRT